jgi:heme/copper-type cytochrome/quinol oxidase subunit 3
MNARPTIYPGLKGPLPIEVNGPKAPGYMAMLLVIATDGMIFACLLVSYFYLQAGHTPWPPAGIKKPDLGLISVSTVILWASSIPMQMGEGYIKEGHRGRLAAALAIAFAMGLLFLVLQGVEYSRKEFGPQENVYGSLFYTITGFHGLHVLSALIMNVVIQVRAWVGHFDQHRHLAVRNVVIFWHFVDFIWIFVFASLYLSPYAT